VRCTIPHVHVRTEKFLALNSSPVLSMVLLAFFVLFRLSPFLPSTET
jgi:hypothetical protein